MNSEAGRTKEAPASGAAHDIVCDVLSKGVDLYPGCVLDHPDTFYKHKFLGLRPEIIKSESLG